MGFKAQELLKLIPIGKGKISTIERCSGHGGSWGAMQVRKKSHMQKLIFLFCLKKKKKETHPVALKVGKNVFSKVKNLATKDPSTEIKYLMNFGEN